LGSFQFSTSEANHFKAWISQPRDLEAALKYGRATDQTIIALSRKVRWSTEETFKVQ